MAEDNKLNLFSDDGNTVVLPSESNLDTTEDLISKDIGDAILGDIVKTIIIPEGTEIADNNYIFDFTELSLINSIQRETLKSLISLEGDVVLYLYKKESGLISFGMGEKFKLEQMVPLVKHHVFDNKIRVYKNFKIGEALDEVTTRDITKMRLHL